MKKIATAFSALLLVFAMSVSCKGESKPEDSKDAAETMNEERFDDVNENKEDDSEILVDAAETNLTEIEIGKLAQTKGTSAHVKEFGKMLEDDHTKAQSDLKALADGKSISLPLVVTDDGKEAYAKLNGKSAGKDFDKEFADMMVKGHEEAISEMEDASKI